MLCIYKRFAGVVVLADVNELVPHLYILDRDLDEQRSMTLHLGKLFCRNMRA